ncbi:hypothetical protein HOT99_gp174 [Caulobacter phage CcrBL10]|uniref:Uncharacterized protein n=1 Tax=Caulobacter phage CcrBL10 TaxID=2283269 RepID=A0A385E9G1_9CAUD|nr:hypothetical protein HOT99_gp174 [Caulobacter phage CcrBL10]AXQ68443.1 hypothetical protein CcrBL10_gp239 [Caulobacter phage CcrBL10]
MIDPKASLAQQTESFLGDGRALAEVCQREGTYNLADQTLAYIADAETIIEAQRKRITQFQEEKLRNWGTNNAYLRVIQEFIAGRANPHLKALQDLGGMTIVQGRHLQQTIDKFNATLRAEGISGKELTGKGKRLIDLVEFFVFHEIHRIAWYIEKFVGRDIHLAVAGLTPADIKDLPNPEPPQPQEMPS